MNNPVPHDAPSTETEAGQTMHPMWYLKYWPGLVVGVLLSMGILGVNAEPGMQGLVWLPPAIALGLLLFAIISFPRPKMPKEEPWEKREREAAEAAKASADEAPVAAEVAAEEPAEAAPAPAPKAAAAPVVAGDVDVLILWGSETGTAQGLAEMVEGRLKDGGASARAISMGDVKLNQLPGFNKVLIITSTWGDGEPPSNGIDLWEAFQKEKVDMSKTRFSVLSLGDTAYPQFCKCGKDFDAFLESQGAQRLHPRVDCDLDYEANFEKWFTGEKQAIG